MIALIIPITSSLYLRLLRALPGILFQLLWGDFDQACCQFQHGPFGLLEPLSAHGCHGLGLGHVFLDDITTDCDDCRGVQWSHEGGYGCCIAGSVTYRLAFMEVVTFDQQPLSEDILCRILFLKLFWKVLPGFFQLGEVVPMAIHIPLLLRIDHEYLSGSEPVLAIWHISLLWDK